MVSLTLVLLIVSSPGISNLYIVPRSRITPENETDDTANQIETYPGLYQLVDAEIPDEEWHNPSNEEEETSGFKASSTLENSFQGIAPINISAREEPHYPSLDENVHSVFSEDDDIFFEVDPGQYDTSGRPNQNTTESAQHEYSIQLEKPLSVKNVSTKRGFNVEPHRVPVIENDSVLRTTSMHNIPRSQENISASTKHEFTNVIRTQKASQNVPLDSDEQDYPTHIERPPWNDDVPEKKLKINIIDRVEETQLFHPAHMKNMKFFPEHSPNLTGDWVEGSGDAEAFDDSRNFVTSNNIKSSGDEVSDAGPYGDIIPTIEDMEGSGKDKYGDHTEGSADKQLLENAEVLEHTERNINSANATLCVDIASSGDQRSSYDHQQSPDGTNYKPEASFTAANTLDATKKSPSVETSSKFVNSTEIFDDAEGSGDYSGSGDLEYPIVSVSTDHTKNIVSFLTPKDMEGSGNTGRSSEKDIADAESSGETESSGYLQGSGDFENEEATKTQPVSIKLLGRSDVITVHIYYPEDGGDLYFDSP